MNQVIVDESADKHVAIKSQDKTAQHEIAVDAERLHYMDNLRALAMLAGVFLHIGLSHSLFAHEFWPTADNQSSSIPDFLIWFVHGFRMPLFFLVAGFLLICSSQKGE